MSPPRSAPCSCTAAVSSSLCSLLPPPPPLSSLPSQSRAATALSAFPIYSLLPICFLCSAFFSASCPHVLCSLLLCALHCSQVDRLGARHARLVPSAFLNLTFKCKLLIHVAPAAKRQFIAFACLQDQIAQIGGLFSEWSGPAGLLVLLCTLYSWGGIVNALE